MKEAGGYEVIGTTSYGKGTVQVSMPLDDHSSLKNYNSSMENTRWKLD